MLVRGLDYYTRTTSRFRPTGSALRTQCWEAAGMTACPSSSAGRITRPSGLPLGMERLITLLQEEGQEKTPVPDLFIIGLGEEAQKKAFSWACDLRKSGFWVETDYGSKGLKAQLRRADRLGASRVLIVRGQ